MSWSKRYRSEDLRMACSSLTRREQRLLQADVYFVQLVSHYARGPEYHERVPDGLRDSFHDTSLAVSTYDTRFFAVLLSIRSSFMSAAFAACEYAMLPPNEPGISSMALSVSG